MILYLGNKLSKHGFSPSVIEELSPLLSENHHVISASSLRNPLLRIAGMTCLLFKYRNSCNLVLIDTYSTRAFFISCWLAVIAKLSGIPFALFLHGGNLPSRLDRNPMLCKWLFHSASVNISPSLYLQEEFSSRGFQVSLVPNFIDLNSYSYRHRTSVEPRILWVRAFHRIYNPSLAIFILIQLKKKYPGATLCMVGPDKDGSQLECQKLVLENGLGSAVEFTGKLSKEDWIQLSDQFDIFINTTNFDNMPVSVIEAMALGLPVISTNVGGIPYLIKNGENGLLVEANDVEGFVRSIEGLIISPDVASRLSERSRKFAEQFSWEQVKPLWTNIINQYQRV